MMRRGTHYYWLELMNNRISPTDLCRLPKKYVLEKNQSRRMRVSTRGNVYTPA
ncbi:unnamed protein product [Arabidopsis halleri]